MEKKKIMNFGKTMGIIAIFIGIVVTIINPLENYWMLITGSIIYLSSSIIEMGSYHNSYWHGFPYKLIEIKNKK